DLADHLHPLTGVRVRSWSPDAGPADPGALVVVLLGPDPARHLDPDGLPAVLSGLRPGARTVLLCAWPVASLPYHRLLPPLVGARCQVREAVPVERSPVAGVECAVVAARVDALLPMRA